MTFNQTLTFNRNDRNAVASEIKRINNERNAYQFRQTTEKNGSVKVTRIVPTNLYDRKLYIEGITKNQLNEALRANQWSKEGAARNFGISARSIGRMIAKHGVVAKRYTPTTSKTTSSRTTARTASKTSRTASKSKQTR